MALLAKALWRWTVKKIYGSIFILFVIVVFIGVLNNKKVLSKGVSNIRGNKVAKVYITGDIHGLLGIERVLNIIFLKIISLRKYLLYNTILYVPVIQAK